MHSWDLSAGRDGRMGPKARGAAPVVAYIPGTGEKPTAEKVAEATETIKALADELAVIWAEAAAAVRNIVATMVRACEIEKAIRWAEVANKPLAYRYHHTKKKRTRKKYAKRILAWYREEIL